MTAEKKVAPELLTCLRKERRMRIVGNAFLPAAGLVAAFAIAGCGSSSNGSSASASNAPENAAANAPAAAAPPAMMHACDLLTLDTAKTFIGAGAKQTMRAQPNPRMTHCHYNSSSGSIDVMLGPWSFINAGQEHVPGEKPLAGFGDEAHINVMALRVRKGDHAMEISATGAAGTYQGAAADAETAHGQDLEKKVAKALLPRL